MKKSKNEPWRFSKNGGHSCVHVGTLNAFRIEKPSHEHLEKQCTWVNTQTSVQFDVHSAN